MYIKAAAEVLLLYASYMAVIVHSCPPQKMLLKKNCGGKTRTIKIRVSFYLTEFPTVKKKKVNLVVF